MQRKVNWVEKRHTSGGVVGHTENGKTIGAFDVKNVAILWIGNIGVVVTGNLLENLPGDRTGVGRRGGKLRQDHRSPRHQRVQNRHLFAPLTLLSPKPKRIWKGKNKDKYFSLSLSLARVLLLIYWTPPYWSVIWILLFKIVQLIDCCVMCVCACLFLCVVSTLIIILISGANDNLVLQNNVLRQLSNVLRQCYPSV